MSDGSVPVIAVSDGEGVSFRAATTLDEIGRVDIDEGASGMRWVQDGPDDPTLYVAAGTTFSGSRWPTTAPTRSAT
ncbi:MAG: hypothetical protein R3C32_04370 [Chloroflexota bacterium]